MLTLREKNRRRTLRDTQRAAMRLFLERGFDSVSVEEIAEVAGIAGSTVYRHFKTKEGIVLWDEHDTALDAVLADSLGRRAPLDAIRDALVETLAERYLADLEFQLSRVRFIFATPALHAAAIEADFRAREELTRALTVTLTKKNKSAAPLLAGAALLALDLAMDNWQRSDGKQRLDSLIAVEFDRLADLASIR